MVALKVFGILAGCFLLLGFLLSETLRYVDPGLIGVITLVGVLVCGLLATAMIRRYLRRVRREEMHHETD